MLYNWYRIFTGKRMASVFRVVILGVLAAGWLVLGQASAAVLNYDEAVDGDINFDTFNLDVGVNKVAGQS